ncbi:ABC transporter permease subunit [Pseudomonas sp. GNP013]
MGSEPPPAFILGTLPTFLKAVGVTLQVGLIAIATSLLVALINAALLVFRTPYLARLVAWYVELARNTPLLIQLFFVYFALPAGRGDAYAQDNLVLFSWAKQNPGYRVLDEKLGDEAPIAPAVKKGNIELRDWVNVELAKLGEEKFLLKLYDQYVRKELSDDTKPESVIVEGGKWQG